MINTGKKDIIVSYISYFLRLTSNFLLLPIILGMLTSEEYGLWNVYISVGAIVNLVDVGFGAILTRYSIYAFCGAKEIDISGMPTMSELRQTNYHLLFRIFFVAKQIYNRLFITSLIISIILSLYICFVAQSNITILNILISWGIYAFSCCMYIYYVAYNCIIKGMGKIKESNYYCIIQQVIYLITGYLFLYLKMGLIGLALSNLISTFIFRFLNIRFLNKKFLAQKDIFQLVKNENLELRKTIYNAVKKNTKGIALVTFSNYISHYGMTLVCSLFLPLEIIGSIGITNQLVGVVATISGTPFSTYMSKMGDMLITNQITKLKKTFKTVTFYFFISYIMGAILIIDFGPFVLKLIGSETQLLSTLEIVLLLLSNFIISNHQRCTNFIMLGNAQPHIKSYIFSSFLTLILSVMSMFTIRNVMGYIIPSLIIQILYNGWKWPLEAYKLINKQEREIKGG